MTRMPACTFVLPFAVLTLDAMAQAPNLLPATPLPGATAVGKAAGTQRNARAAAGATSTLVVFEDTRGGDTDVFGVRVDAAGMPIDAVPFLITTSPGHQRSPRAVWNGQQWLVAYVSEYDPGSGYFAQQLRAQRVTAQGDVLDAGGLVVGADSTGMYFDIASDGVGWVATWTGFSAGNSDIRARRITAAGALLDPGGVVVRAATSSIFFQLGAAFAGGSYLFTWDENGTRGRRFATTLTPVDPAPVTLAVPGPTLIANGSQFLAAWVRQTPQFTYEVVCQRLAANLTLVDAAPIVLSNPATSANPADAMATWDGGQWIVAWTVAAWDVRACRVAGNGAVLDPGGIVLPDNAGYVFYSPFLAALPAGGALQCWHEARFGSADDVFASVLSAAGQPGPERCLSLGTEAQYGPRVTAGDGIYLITTAAERSDGSRICAWRVDALGRPLDAAPLEAMVAPHARLQNGGAAWNGSCFLCVFGDAQSGQVFARRLTAAGAWLDAAPIAVQPGYAPDVAALGGNFLVTALRSVSHPHYVFSFGVRVRGSDGAVLDNPPIGIGPSYAAGARVVELAGRWLVATEAHASHDMSQASIVLQFVDGNGAVTAATSMGILNIQNWGSVDLASSGTSALVVSQSGSNWTNTEVYIGRVLPNGTMPAPMQAITNAAGMGQSRANVLWNGHEYFVGYHTYQNNVWFYDLEPDLYGIRTAETGTPIDPNGHALWNGEDHEIGITGDGLGYGKALFAASVFDGSLAAMRVQVRVQRPLGLSALGVGTPGCFGPHGIDGISAPIGGNLGFAVQVDRGPVGGPGIMAIGTVGDAIGFDPGLGVLMHVAVAPPAVAVLLGMPVDAAGRGTVSLPLPAQPSLYGTRVFAQGAFLWNGPCFPSPLGLSTSPGLEVRIQAP